MIRSIALAALAAVSLVWSAPPARPATTIPSVTESPCFFEFHLARYAEDENLALMPEGRISMPPHGVQDISSFTWHGPGDSFMMDMEELLYLLPFIASQRDEDRSFAIRWVEGWADAHRGFAEPNKMAWDGMTTGIRAMVLVYFCRRESQRPDGGISDRLASLIADHHAALSHNHYDIESNHSVWQALGLVEVNRVLPDSATVDLGLSRLVAIAMYQVSTGGVHMEHAPQYHFVVLGWLDEITRYFESIPGFSPPAAAVLHDTRDMMLSAGYFLQDHDGAVIPIGDSFRRPVPEMARVAPPPDPVLFDPEAGYACYKEPRGGEAPRQVVFNIQPQKRPFPFHFHDDALAVVYYVDGEFILGDQGGYDYGSSVYRQYVYSATAHNLTGPWVNVFRAQPQGPERSRVVRPSVGAGGDVVFRAGRRYTAGYVDRTVKVDDPSHGLVVTDNVLARAAMVTLWHLGPDVAGVTADSVATGAGSGAFEASWMLQTARGRALRLTVEVSGADGEPEARVVRGSKHPMLGWYSPSFETIVPASVIMVKFTAADSARVRTTVRPAQ